MASSSGNPPENIGLFGATFDPPHFAHLTALLAAYEQLNLSKILLIPANINPLKQTHTPAPPQIRLQMLAAMTAQYPYMRIYTGEIDRGGISYMIDTLKELLTLYPPPHRFYLLLGADVAKHFHRWKDYLSLPQFAEIVIFNRPGYNLNNISANLPFPHRLLHIPPMKISSSKIRRKIKTGQAIASEVPPPVARIIFENKLYL